MAEISVMDKLQKAHEARQRGDISQREFDAYKAELLGSSKAPGVSGSASPPPPPPGVPPPPPPREAPPAVGGLERRRQGAPSTWQDRSPTLTDTPPILRDSGPPVRVILEFRDAANAVVGPDDVPTWTEDSNSQVISLEVAADGRSATITPRGIGRANVTVTTHDNDGTTVQVAEEVAVVAGEPTHGRLQWTHPEPVAARGPTASP